jgi:hypothetical protein
MQSLHSRELSIIVRGWRWRTIYFGLLGDKQESSQKVKLISGVQPGSVRELYRYLISMFKEL